MEKVKKVNDLIGTFVVFACGIMVFQNFAIPLASSRYDLSCFLILFAIIFFRIKNKELNISIAIFFTFFLIIEMIKILYFQYSSISRLISGLVWFGGLLLIFLKKDFVIYNQELVMKSFLFGFFITIIWFLKQYFIGIDLKGFSESVFRPRGFFDEPSYAGLFLYSISAASLGSLALVKNERNQKYFISILGLLAFIFAATTLTMHIVTFIFSMMMVVLITLIVSHNSIYKIFIFLTSLLFVGFIITFMLTQEHFIERLSFFGSYNLSIVAWLQGLDQALTSISSSPIIGFGLGSTGGFDFISDTHYKLEIMNKIGQNRFDGYSMIYRLIIEMGLMLILFILFEIFKECVMFTKTIIKFHDHPAIRFYVFNFIFSFTLLIGVLIKEPTYARSYVYVGVLIFFTARNVFKSQLQEFN
jgi:hypothetical protein